LPPGLRLDGATGELTGTPIAPGTYMTELSVIDLGEANNVVTVLPLVVMPAGSNFRFTTFSLNNGEVGTPFCDSWTVADPGGSVDFSAGGLPAGLILDPATGVITGTPTMAGTFGVTLTASDSSDTISMKLRMTIAPSDTSAFHWEFIALPTAVVDESYTRQPAIELVARNGGTVTYTATGLPDGILFNTSTGELSGTATEVGEYPVAFTADDSTSGESLTLSLTFLVLPPEGGDVNNIITNLWIAKEKLKSGTEGKDQWAAVVLYNADRRTGAAFDPVTDALSVAIGSVSLDLPPDSLQGSPSKLSFKSPSGELPIRSVGLAPGKQLLAWSIKKATLSEAVPGDLDHTITLGDTRYQLLGFVNQKGSFRPALSYRRPAFVVAKGSLTGFGEGADKLKILMLLADPVFGYEPGVDTLRFRLLNDAEVLVDRDFGALGSAKITTDNATGVTLYSLKTLKDEELVDRLDKFKLITKTGKALLGMSSLDIGTLPADEAHLTFELTIGDRVYATHVTFFETKPGVWSTQP
jgi:hypothetical protein